MKVRHSYGTIHVDSFKRWTEFADTKQWLTPSYEGFNRILNNPWDLQSFPLTKKTILQSLHFHTVKLLWLGHSVANCIRTKAVSRIHNSHKFFLRFIVETKFLRIFTALKNLYLWHSSHDLQFLKISCTCMVKESSHSWNIYFKNQRKNSSVQDFEPSHAKQLFLNHVWKIGLSSGGWERVRLLAKASPFLFQ